MSYVYRWVREMDRGHLSDPVSDPVIGLVCEMSRVVCPGENKTSIIKILLSKSDAVMRLFYVS